jgi:hypothetical protein
LAGLLIRRRPLRSRLHRAPVIGLLLILLSRTSMLSLVRVALFFTFVVLVNASLGTRRTLGTRTLHLAVKVNLTAVNETVRLLLRCGCFREANPATD